LVSFITFLIIQLPPGDFLTTYMQTLASAAGGTITPELQQQVDGLRIDYGLDQPVYVQYWKWISSVVTKGNFGYSFTAQRPVSDFIGNMMANTMILLLGTFVFIFSVALPIGFYSAVKQYSLGDYVFTFLGFLGLAIPSFLLALLLLYALYSWFGVLLTGMYSSSMIDAAWSWAKLIDLLKHIWLPVVVVGTAGTAAIIRVLRNNLLDELNKPYVMTARAKGVPEWRLLLKYPVRIAINPLLSAVGFILPDLFSATIITSVVLNLPTVGPMYLTSLLNQDMYLAGAIVMLLATMTVVGTIVSDILLALADPRIRYDK
jgi:peptide/nickel transport system permease protein